MLYCLAYIPHGMVCVSSRSVAVVTNAIWVRELLDPAAALAMSGSKGSLESSSHALRSGSAAPAPPVRIPRNAPAPDQWTLVSEMNMEKREPCEVRDRERPMW